jgi:hypothetical protein
MTKTNPQPQPHDLDQTTRERILGCAKTLNVEVLCRLKTAADDLESGEHRAALGALDGIKAQITKMRNILLLLS